MFDPSDLGFPRSWVEALALEWAKAHISDAETVVEFTNIYIDAANAIREAIKNTYGKP